MKSLELFAGCGGLALGLERAGFQHVALVEWDRHACATLRTNAGKVAGWAAAQVNESDVRHFDFQPWRENLDLITAGVPCQPFSLGGRHRGDRDERNMFPALIAAVRATGPKAVLIENVRGLARESFRPYLEYIIDQLRIPELGASNGEIWRHHHRRLRRQLKLARDSGLRYHVDWRLLNAANFGVPQSRQRVIIQAIRTDVADEVPWPAETHSAMLLSEAQRDGTYWSEHGMLPVGQPLVFDGRAVPFAGTSRWRTVRDALKGVRPPAPTVETAELPNHVHIPGARLYQGHSGSRLDFAAKTLKAGVHGVAGGEAIVLLDDGAHRYFSVREAALIQSFPKDYVFCGSRTEAMRQIGNAVPVDLAAALGSSLHFVLSRSGEEAVAASF